MSERLRFSLCLMVGAYPLITGLLILSQHLTEGWSIPLRTALIVPFMVIGMVYGVIPATHRLAGRWIKAGG